MIFNRKAEASKTLLVQVNSEKSYPELFSYCSNFGVIKDSFHYKLSDEDFHFILIEYENVADYQDAIRSGQFNEDSPGVPVKSPFMWFKAGPKIKEKQNDIKDLALTEGNKSISKEELNDLLSASENLEDQIKILHKVTCLNDLGVRLRFMAAKQIEQPMLGMFPKVQALAFGSSVNGFGKINSDLDIILKLSPDVDGVSSHLYASFHLMFDLLIVLF